MADQPRVVELADLAATESLAGEVAAWVRIGDVILLEGPLGVGKTAFARAFLRALTDDPEMAVPSPSFTLVQTYETPAGPVHHYDLWRLTGPAQLPELGWEAALADIVMVEWPERLEELRPADALLIEMSFAGNEARLARIHGWSDRPIE